MVTLKSSYMEYPLVIVRSNEVERAATGPQSIVYPGMMFVLLSKLNFLAAQLLVIV